MYIYIYSNYDQLPSLIIYYVCVQFHVQLFTSGSSKVTDLEDGRDVPQADTSRDLSSERLHSRLASPNHPKTEDNCSCGPVAVMFMVTNGVIIPSHIIIIPAMCFVPSLTYIKLVKDGNWPSLRGKLCQKSSS